MIFPRVSWLLSLAVACAATPATPRQPQLVATLTAPGSSDVPAAPSQRVAQRAIPKVEPVAPAPKAPPGDVAVWRDGRQVAMIARERAEAQGLTLLDVGKRWVPSLFRSVPEVPHAYETTFADLANAQFDDGPEGRRARHDRYLELYGIPPSPDLLASRFDWLDARPCAHRLPLDPLRSFEGVTWRERQPRPDAPVGQAVIDALQLRLICEGHLRRAASGKLDRPTRHALAEFERRNRIYARGNLEGATLSALGQQPLELERRALLRVLTERLVLDLGVMEDRSGIGHPPLGNVDAGRIGVAPDVVGRIEKAVRQAFALDDVAATRRFYRQLRGGLADDHYVVAIEPIELPDYHEPHMELFVEIDRGDIYYDFPFDEEGNKREQPIEDHPTLTLFARHHAEVIPLASYGTTIGGWRVQRVRGRDVWTYKESPVGPRVWSRIVSAPTWLPPRGMPPESLVLQTRSVDGEPIHEINDNLVGPGYASAYGLAVAYHQLVEDTRNGELVPGDDEGIRTHGSSDYTSIWQRASLGCHRLHNHLALRLFTFLLAHRDHRRLGHRRVGYRRRVRLSDFSTVLEVKRTGYEYQLTPPLPVEVLPGRIRGERQRPPDRPIPVDTIDDASGPS